MKNNSNELVTRETWDEVKRVLMLWVKSKNIRVNSTHVEDAIQEVVCNLLTQKISKNAIDEDGKIKRSYLYVSCQNHIKDLLKSKEVKANTNHGDIFFETDYQKDKMLKDLEVSKRQKRTLHHILEDDMLTSIKRDYRNSEKMKLIIEAIESLNQCDKKVALLMLDGYSYNEINEQLGKVVHKTRWMENIKKEVKRIIERDDLRISV